MPLVDPVTKRGLSPEPGGIPSRCNGDGRSGFIAPIIRPRTGPMMNADEPRLNHVQCLDARACTMAYWGGATRPTPRRGLRARPVAPGRDFDTLAEALSAANTTASSAPTSSDAADRTGWPTGRLPDPELCRRHGDAAGPRLDAPAGGLGRHVDGRADRDGSRVAAGTPIAPRAQRRRPGDRRAALERIGTYLGAPRALGQVVDEAADYLLTISQGFGPHPRASGWR